MNLPALPDNVRELIRASVPNIDALEVLVLLARDPGPVTPATLHESLRSPGLTVTLIGDYLALLVSHGIAAERPRGAFACAPATGPLREAVTALLDAYERRPVTLIRTVYEIADSRNIRSLADAFRLRKTPP